MDLRAEEDKRMMNDDNLLVQRLKQGNEGAFVEMVDKYKGKAFGIAYHFTNNVEDAKDLSQEAFVRVYRSIDRFKEHSSFYTWLYRILVNLCIDFARRKEFLVVPFSQFRKRDESNESNPEEWIQDKKQDNPAKTLLVKELNEKISQAIDVLTPKQRIVFILRNFEGLSLKEIAELMSCAEGTVKSHLARAIRRLQGILQHYVFQS